MKTAVSIPDPVFNEADALAKRMGITRSKLYARALGAFVATQTSDRITQAMNDSIDAAGNGADPFAKEGARRILERSEW